MRRSGWWTFVRYSCQVLQWLSYAALGMVGGAKLADVSQAGAFSPLLIRLQHVSWWAMPVIFFGNIAFQAGAKAISPPWVWDTVRSVLDQLQLHAFSPTQGELKQSNRVTLFKHVRWRWAVCKWPWTGWLVPVERSGNTTRKTDTVFLAPDDGNKAEGIAGRAWACEGTVTVSNLPSVTEDSPETDLVRYADETFITVATLKDRLRCKKGIALSLTAFPVEVKNKVWGVIVFDSRSREALSNDAIDNFKLVGRCLAKVLGGARK